MKKLNLPMDKIIIEYNSGMSLGKLGKKYNCYYGTIKNKLIKYGVIIRSNIEVNSKQLPMNYIIEEYNSGMTSVELGKKYNCSSRLINKKLKEFGINITNYIDLPIDQIITDYKNYMSINEIANKYNCSPNVIYKRLIYSKIQIRTKKEQLSITNTIDLPIKQIILEYKNGINLIELGRKYNCSPDTIKHKLIQNKIHIRTVKEVKNIISTYICTKCGHKYEGRPASQLCPECNSSGYCYKYNKDCREHNREMYDHECFFCGKTEEELGRKHCTHHGDYNKNQGCGNTPDWFLVPLCQSCHGLTGGNKEKRDLWESRILYLHKEYWSDIV